MCGLLLIRSAKFFGAGLAGVSARLAFRHIREFLGHRDVALAGGAALWGGSRGEDEVVHCLRLSAEGSGRGDIAGNDAAISVLRGTAPASRRGSPGYHLSNFAPLAIGHVNPFSGENCPQRAAARFRCTRSRKSTCCCNAIRSAAAIKPWVGRTQAVGHRVIPLDRINSATASRSSSDIFDKSSMFHTRAAGSVSQSLWLASGCHLRSS